MFQVWRDSDLVQRVPIIVTGNDFSTLFAPLIRDGRMSKFYWEPDRVDLLNICHQMYKVLMLPKRSKTALSCNAYTRLTATCAHYSEREGTPRLANSRDRVPAAQAAHAPCTMMSGLLLILKSLQRMGAHL